MFALIEVVFVSNQESLFCKAKTVILLFEKIDCF